MILIQIFITFFKIGAFSFGGGYAMLPIIIQEVVDNNQWIKKEDFINMVSISQITPGPIAINTATFVGYVVNGFKGSIFATIAVILPSIILVVLAFKFIQKFKENRYLKIFLSSIKVVVVGLIGAGFITILIDGVNSAISILIFAVSFYMVAIKKINPITTILIAGIVGAVIL